MNRALSIVIIALCCYSCKNSEIDTSVKHYGALRNLMSGNLEAVVSLDTIPTINLYALGALENLKGEVQIFNGEPFNSKTSPDGSVTIIEDYNLKASLLVYAQVPKWTKAISLEDFSDTASLESQIKKYAIEYEIDVTKPIPFLLEGKATQVNWHVINWPEDDPNHSHIKHIESGAHGTLNDINVSIIGFYSEKHKAVFTHHTTFLHMHLKTEKNPTIAGHVDYLSGDSLKLFLPKS